MADFFYKEFMRGLLDGEFDLVADDIREMLVMTNTTADTEKSAKFVGDLTTLDEYDGANYARQAFAGKSAVVEGGTDAATYDANDVVYSSLGAGTRQAQARVIYKHTGVDDNANPLIAYLDSGGFPFTGNGGNVTVQMNAAGVARLSL